MSKIVAITSGTAGIGAAIVKTLIKSNKDEIKKIYVNYGHNDKLATAFIDEFTEEEKNKIELIKADMSSEEGLNIFTKKIIENKDKIDWLILNTGIGTYKPFDEYTLGLWNDILTTNISIPAMLTQKLSKNIVPNGSVLFMGSYAGIEPYSSSVAYSVSKAGVNFLAKSLVKVFEDKDIRVNAIAPAFIETRWQDERSDENRNRINAKIAKHRFGTPEEVAKICYDVLSNEYMNGTVIPITGGYNYF